MNGASRTSDGGNDAEIVTPLSLSESSSCVEDEDSESLMDTDEDDGIMLFRSLNYRPGLCYDFLHDQWTTLPPRCHVTTSSPTTTAFHDRVLVLGGYRSSSENALSCYRHREEHSILDYEDHLDYCWWYIHKSQGQANEAKSENASGEWTFGGGTTMLGHRQAFAHSSDMASAVAAASAVKDEMNDMSNMPCGAPVPVRGATATIYQNRLTLSGGLSTFSQTFYDQERKTIWQFFPEHCEWRRAPMTLPVPALLGGYSFSACL